MADPIITANHLVKEYIGGKRAVDDISFAVEKGEIFGFLGPNGAGKTTAIRILVTLLRRTSGELSVCGMDPGRDGIAVRRRIGYAAQTAAIDNDLTTRENLVMRARLYGVKRSESYARSNQLIEQFNLHEFESIRASFLSGGTRRRLDIALSLVHKPELVFLDEPTTGLDPQSRLALWRHLSDLSQAGVTIFLTTQYLEEADRLCARIAIVDQGKILAEGRPATMKSDLGVQTVTVECGSLDSAEQVIRIFSYFAPRSRITRRDSTVSVLVSDHVGALTNLLQRTQERQIPIVRIETSGPTLEEVFLQFTGDSPRDDNPSAYPMFR